MKYELWLSSLTVMSHQKKRKLKEMYKKAEVLYYIEERELSRHDFLSKKDIDNIVASKTRWNIAKEYQKIQLLNIRLITWKSKEYPQKLENIADPPYALFVRGRLPNPNKFAASIVGARRCTPYGAAMARKIAEELASNDVEIISGMAKGIDAIAARGALNGEGSSYAVLGSGIDVCYPNENKGLYNDLQKQGGIISELPLASAPLRHHFPARNRIISALADLVLVIEAKARSGSLITAEMALEQGKEIYALPGPVTSELSKGCNCLISQGAQILIGIEELLDDITTNYKYQMSRKEKSINKLSDEERKVYGYFNSYPVNLENLIRRVDLTISELLGVIVELELKGYIEEISKNYYVRCR